MRLIPVATPLVALAAVAGIGPNAVAERATPKCHGMPADFVGTDGNDHFTEDGGVFVLGSGDDRVKLGASSAPGAVVCGDAGNDEVNIYDDGGGGEFLFDGGSGHDALRGSGYTDTGNHLFGPMRMLGGPGEDHLFSDGRNDHLLGGSGDDVLWGARGNDVLRGGGGDDTLEGNYNKDRLFGNAGDDSLDGDDGIAWGDRPRAFDMTDGGSGFDRCEGERRRSCERVGTP